MRQLLFGVLVVAVTAGCTTMQTGTTTTAAGHELQPLMAGWERHFSVTWDATQRHGRPTVEGYVANRSPYRVGNLRVLVDALDDTGRIVGQRVSWVLGELGGDSRLYFEVPVPSAARYRVRVFSYDRIDEAALRLP
jgi:hypothetical protein